MNLLSLKSLINASAEPGQAQVCVPSAQQKAHLEELAQSMKALGIDSHSNSYQGTSPTLYLDLNRRGRLGYSSFYYSVVIGFSKEGVRQLYAGHTSGEGVPLTSLEQLQRLTKKLNERLDQEQARQSKRDKILRLKQRSIETQVEELARRLRFAYALRPMQLKTKLYVRVSDADAMVIDVPHKALQETLDRLETLLVTVRQLAGEGLHFQMARLHHVPTLREPSGAAPTADEDEEEDHEGGDPQEAEG